MKKINEELAERIYQELVKNNIIAEYDRGNFVGSISGHLGEFHGQYRMLNQYGSRFDFIVDKDQVSVKPYCNVDVKELNIELNKLIQ